MRPVFHRYALVVASQCPSMGPLDSLNAAAYGLSSALTDPNIGACVPALKDTSLVVGELPESKVRDTVKEAINRAGRDNATLVLAFLGHGFTAGSGLYLMVKESIETVPSLAVDINDLIKCAIYQPGVDGVLAIVDTCAAGAALPQTTDLIGERRARLAMLMASGADQPALGLRFTLALTKMLRTGVDEAGPFLDTKVAMEALQDQRLGQDINYLTYDRDSFGTEPWLGRNRRHPSFAEDRSAAPAPIARPTPLTRSELQTMTRLLLAVPSFSVFAQAQTVITKLPPPIPALILPKGARWLDVPLLLRTFEDYPELEPWRELISALRVAPDNSPDIERLESEARRLGLMC